MALQDLINASDKFFEKFGGGSSKRLFGILKYRDNLKADILERLEMSG